jgi:hypothetical protein
MNSFPAPLPESVKTFAFLEAIEGYGEAGALAELKGSIAALNALAPGEVPPQEALGAHSLPTSWVTR